MSPVTPISGVLKLNELELKGGIEFPEAQLRNLQSLASARPRVLLEIVGGTGLSPAGKIHISRVGRGGIRRPLPHHGGWIAYVNTQT